jgi:hypothetical protein
VTGLLCDPYLDELRAMSKYIDETFAWLDTLNPPPAPSDLSLSPDAGKDGVGGGLSSTHQGVK